MAKPQSNFKKDKLVHPTQKPLQLFQRIIQENSNIGQIVLDPFAGAGTTLIAAKRSNRKAICIELDKQYCQIAIKRLNQDLGL